MNKLSKALLITSVGLGASSLSAGLANINYGSEIANGGAQFFGADSLVADNIALGYFAGDTVNTDLTGWNEFGSSSTFAIGAVSNNALADVETGAADGFTAYILISDGLLNGLVTLDSWATYTGAVGLAPTPTLNFEIGSSDSSADLTTYAGVGTQVIVTDGQGINFAGGFSGSGVSISLAAVPEPSTYAALSGLLALSYVLVRRRRA